MLKRLPIILSIFLVIVFSLPEMLLWGKVDQFQTPVRHYEGDIAHYMAILHAAQIEGTHTVNAYFQEQADEPAQFFLFQSIIGVLTPLIQNLNVVWLAFILKVLVITSVFLLLGKLLQIFDVKKNISYLIAFAFVLLYGPASFQGYALSFWFLPFFLGSLYLLAQFNKKEFISWIDLGRPLLAIFLACIHPVYFAIVGLAGFLLMIFKWHKERFPLYLLAIWTGVSAVLFTVLFSSFLVYEWPAAQDALYRIVAIDTRLPIHILYTLRLFILGLLSYLFFKEGKKEGWLVIAAFSMAAIVGINSYIITGTYIVNDHYGIIEDFLTILLLAGLISDKSLQISHNKILGSIYLLISIISILTILDYLNFRPGYYGKWAPLHFSLLSLSFIILLPKVRDYMYKVFSNKFFISIILVFIPFLYANALIYKDQKPHLSRHLEAQQYRDLINALDDLPKSVILANPEISEIIHLSTHHNVYWSSVAFSESVPNDELIKRWSEARAFFKDDEGLFGPGAIGSVVGTINRCSDFGRKRWMDLADKVGLDKYKEVFCAPLENREKSFYELENSINTFKINKAWQPYYQLDLLIVLDTDNVTDSLLKNFTLEADLKGVKIYKLNKI